MAFPSTTFLNIPAVASGTGALLLGIGEIDGVYFEQDVAQIYTGSSTDKILTVERTMRMRVQCWGAGGGGGQGYYNSAYLQQRAGGAEYREATFTLTPGNYTLLIGTGGGGSSDYDSRGGWGGGGGGGVYSGGTTMADGVNGTPWANGGINTSGAKPSINNISAGGGGGAVGLFETLTKSQANAIIVAAASGGASERNNGLAAGTGASVTGGAGFGAKGVKKTTFPSSLGGGGGSGYIGGQQAAAGGAGIPGEGYTRSDGTAVFQEGGQNGNAGGLGGGKSQDNYPGGSTGNGGFTTAFGGNGAMALTLLAWE